IGAFDAEPNGLEAAGAAYVVFGEPALPAELPLADLDGSNGFVIEGAFRLANTGASGAALGDINGDGIDDLALGAPGPGSAGTTYILFGRSDGFPPVLDPSTLDGSDGFALQARPDVAPQGALGDDVAGVGDFNGDAINDFVVSAPLQSHSGGQLAGEGYLVFGSAVGFPAVLDLDTLDGVNGTILRPTGDFLLAGLGLGSGDFNDDGLDDVLMSGGNGGPGREATVYVINGTEDAQPAITFLAQLTPPAGGFFSDCDRDFFPVCDDDTGLAMAGADINGDGVDDAVLGTSARGEVFVFYGDPAGFPSPFRVEDLNGSNGFVFQVDNAGEGGAASLGDFNGDGLDDIVLASPFTDIDGQDSVGQAYVVYGSADGFDPVFPWPLLDGSNGFVVRGVAEDDAAGYAVSSAGDVNGDGAPDLLLGAPQAFGDFPRAPGQAYLIYGIPASGDTVEDFEDFADGDRPDTEVVGILAGAGLQIDCRFGADDNDPRCASLVRFFPNARVVSTPDAFSGDKALRLEIRAGTLNPPPQSYLVLRRPPAPLDGSAALVFDLQFDAAASGARRITVEGSVDGEQYITLGSITGPRDTALRENIRFPLDPQLQTGADLLLRVRAFAFDPSATPLTALIDNIDVVRE
ncbi:MAG: hypothetical protein AAF184_25460, partial [Pseudomonadota bacterium]